jgi:hypothetical protein
VKQPIRRWRKNDAAIQAGRDDADAEPVCPCVILVCSQGGQGWVKTQSRWQIQLSSGWRNRADKPILTLVLIALFNWDEELFIFLSINKKYVI